MIHNPTDLVWAAVRNRVYVLQQSRAARREQWTSFSSNKVKNQAARTELAC